MTSSTPNPSWMKRTSGSSGTRTTRTCALTQSATCAPGIDAYQNTAGRSTFWIDYPSPHSILRISSTSPTRSPFPECLSTDHRRRLSAPAYIGSRLVAASAQVWRHLRSAGLMQIGDLDRLWYEMTCNPSSRFEVLSYNAGGADGRGLSNYCLCSNKNNPSFARCHRLFLEL